MSPKVRGGRGRVTHTHSTPHTHTPPSTTTYSPLTTTTTLTTTTALQVLAKYRAKLGPRVHARQLHWAPLKMDMKRDKWSIVSKLKQKEEDE